MSINISSNNYMKFTNIWNSTQNIQILNISFTKVRHIFHDGIFQSLVKDQEQETLYKLNLIEKENEDPWPST